MDNELKRSKAVVLRGRLRPSSGELSTLGKPFFKYLLNWTLSMKENGKFKGNM